MASDALPDHPELAAAAAALAGAWLGAEGPWVDAGEEEERYLLALDEAKAGGFA
jgi:hypothetical protein